MKKFLVENGRPDKPVPCPRCHSLNTKFCYFNNYNVKQPRHFCRECQRYWTAGGSLRNVPIGAGRRKHKIASPLSAKLHGVTAATKLDSDVTKSAHISPLKPYSSLPLKQLITHNPNGNRLQDVNSLIEMQCDDVLSVCGSNKACLSQVLQKPAIDVTQNSNMAMLLGGQRFNATVLTSTHCDAQQRGGVLQEYARNHAVEAKAMNGHGAHASKSIHEHAGTVQDEVSGVGHGDVCGDSEPDLQPSHITSASVSVTCGVSETVHNTEQCESTTPLTSSASEQAIDRNDSCPAAHSPPNPLGLGSAPAFWGPLMWPWIRPFFADGVSTPNLTAGIGALASSVVPHVEQAVGANIASHMDTTFFPHWPYVWNTLPWGSPWSITWNASNVGDRLCSQVPEKEKQGLLCIPKTLRMDHPDEPAYSSILKTLGVTALPQSGFLNTFQPKADVFQPKVVAPKGVEHTDLHRHPLPHLNPAAQARSVAFQEGS